MGLWWVPLFCPFRSVHHHVYSVYSSIPKSRSPPYISCLKTSLCFMFPFYFAFSFPLFYFLIPDPWPWYMPHSHYPDMSCSNIYMSWTSCMFLSLKLTLIVLWTPSLNFWTHVQKKFFEDSRHLVAQHISWSQVLTKNPAPRYTLSPLSAHNRSRDMPYATEDTQVIFDTTWADAWTKHYTMASTILFSGWLGLHYYHGSWCVYIWQVVQQWIQGDVNAIPHNDTSQQGLPHLEAQLLDAAALLCL